MKKGAAVLLSGLGTMAFAGTPLPFKDYIIDEGIYTIVTETDTQTVMIPKSDFFPKRRVNTLLSYCKDIGGITTFDKDAFPDARNNDKDGILSCTAPNGLGFKAGKI